MEQWRKDRRREPVITELDALVPKRASAAENRKSNGLRMAVPAVGSLLLS